MCGLREVCARACCEARPCYAMCSTAGYEVKRGAMRSAFRVQTMGLHLHCESFGATLGEPTVEYTRGRRHGHFGGSRLSQAGVDNAYGTIRHDI